MTFPRKIDSVSALCGALLGVTFMFAPGLQSSAPGSLTSTPTSSAALAESRAQLVWIAPPPSRHVRVDEGEDYTVPAQSYLTITALREDSKLSINGEEVWRLSNTGPNQEAPSQGITAGPGDVVSAAPIFSPGFVPASAFGFLSGG